MELEWRMQSIMADFGRVSMMLALGSLSYLGGNVRFDLCSQFSKEYY
ncbi:hypothetical protein Hanom_Chr16g01478831 [Helianthus anomalus]